MFLIELNPASLSYLTKLMDHHTVVVKSEDVMTHAQIRQQLANPAESAKLVEQWKQKGAEAVLQPAPAPTQPPPPAPGAPMLAPYSPAPGEQPLP